MFENHNIEARMPALFVGHGSPMYAIEENEFAHQWRSLGQVYPRPKAIIAISAHWETQGTQVTAMAQPPTIHDFGGFPRELYELQYPAPGNQSLASELIETVHTTEVLPDQRWGLDHGTWSVLRRMYPQADIPTVQLSLDYRKTPRQHYDLAKELSVFRNKGVMIVGSGNIVHNLRQVAWDKSDKESYGYDWAIEANEMVKKLILEGDHNSLIEYRKLGSAMQLAAPTPDHFLPLLYILALQERGNSLSFFNDKAVMGSLSMTSLCIK